ncbi:MAG: GspH/FimT family pseudopilin [Thermodesulfobacteriota bacterium]
MKRRRDRGFTLAELVITTAIMAVIAGIGLPNFVEYLPRIRLNGATRQIMTDLMVARMNAVKFACNSTVTFSGNSYTIWVDRDRDGVRDAGEQTVKNITNSFSDVTIIVGQTVRFNSRGAAPTNGWIWLYNTKGYGLINTNLTGRVRIYRYLYDVGYV